MMNPLLETIMPLHPRPIALALMAALAAQSGFAAEEAKDKAKPVYR